MSSSDIFGTCEMSYSVSHNPNLYQWKKFSKTKVVGKKRPEKTKDDDIQMWLQRVEAATEDAVQKTFSDHRGSNERESSRTLAHGRSGDDIFQVFSDIHDNENAHTEAQELVSEWINEKLRFDFLGNDEVDQISHDVAEERTTAGLTAGIETAAHEKWYEDSEEFIQRYLDSTEQKQERTRPNRSGTRAVRDKDVLGKLDIYEADESTVVSALMKNMIEKTVISPSELKALKKRDNLGENGKRTKLRDPQVTMDMRHKQVKAVRLRRQKEEEKKRQDRMIQKEAKFKAQQIIKEEEMQKKLREKHEEEAIQAEMAKLRKEMMEQRKREETQRREKEKEQEKLKAQDEEGRMMRRSEMERAERERQKQNILSEISRLEEKENKVAEVMIKRNTENRRLIQTCFSAWCKMVLNTRVKMGKAKAMSDWKCIQRTWAAWKSYARNQKLDLETRYHQANIRETRLKEKKAVDSARLRLLRKSFFKWKVWVGTEQERKEILKQQQNTKAKMQALLDAVTSGKNAENEQDMLQSLDSQDNVDDLPHFKPQKSKKIVSKPATRETSRKTGVPREAWQVRRKDVHRLKTEDIRQLSDGHVGGQTPQRVAKQSPMSYDPYGNRHKFQKELIEQQRMVLDEQKRMIEEMHEQQKLQALQNEIAILKEQQQVLKKNAHTKTSASTENHSNEAKLSPRNQMTTDHSRPTSSTVSVAKKHPIVSKMEERAAERSRKKKELEELKRKREEEKVKKMKEEEEQKQREEEERKMNEIRERREEKRLQKKLEQEKKAAQERMRELYKAANNHYTISLMKNHGVKPWRKLVDAMRKKEEVANFHYKSNVLRKALLEWKAETERAREGREEKADSLYRNLLIRRGMRCWKKYGERMEILEHKAILHHSKVLKKHYLKYWVDYTTDEKLSQWRKESQANEHNRLRLLRRVFNVVRSYRELVKREIDRRQRLNDMRRKVTQLIPDFQYSQDSLISDDVDGTEDQP